MARLRCDVVADSLGLATSITVLLPQPSRTRIGAGVRDPGAPPPVLYLLHGLSDDDTAWTRYTAIERYADELGLAVVMPQVHRSFYTDQAYGGRYRTWIEQELPELVGRFFRVSGDPDRTFVAGLSMGGYGALGWALRDPGRFGAAASLSGVLDIGALIQGPPREEDPRIWDRIFGGDPVTGTGDDLFTLVDRLPAAAPPLYVCAGTEDPLHPHAERFTRHARAAGIDVTGHDGPGGHEWSYWDARIRDVLDWLPLPR
ncbi:putative esterase [Pseudonocardia sp. Ae168_Ps1]|uniref:alpha/beta hydrolase n=1 Tax=unclassified Pseudonocardia TaxID=2619320 RepID=UPI0001FFEA8C|nr:MULTISPECIES: alpha/beta hydrolase family protein [unclassified Pseudonocardia]ALE74732.1 esterase [Pseudonocardia sp. EC080625-04]ALL78165.1 esterase [Pseudonocardia sp. EC080610-09]ALL81077.1 esterase [Pseudonocardia sp. EC080619-01]OLL76086.1 putative esterase [Pseudonocardia sp. Ae150A_Ps1]OLL82085.1 putative esterase [Pseudonocardia sp. Ae168_Ps1]